MEIDRRQLRLHLVLGDTPVRLPEGEVSPVAWLRPLKAMFGMDTVDQVSS
jgi:hypothetical protein